MIQRDDETIIFCGRGRGFENLPGNRVFRRVIKEHASVYSESVARGQKTIMVNQILDQLIHGSGMQFVKAEKNQLYKTLSINDCKVKVSHALRDAVAELKKQHVKTDAHKNLKTNKRVSSKARRGASANTSITTTSLVSLMTSTTNPTTMIVSDEEESTGSDRRTSADRHQGDDLSDISEQTLHDFTVTEEDESSFEAFLWNLPKVVVDTAPLPADNHDTVSISSSEQATNNVDEQVIDPLHYLALAEYSGIPVDDDPYEPENVYSNIVGI